MKLSILICTLPEPFRDRELSCELFRKLTFQSANKPVEIIYLGDNKSFTVGQKRNRLLFLATGDRLAFVDDDDQISNNYIDKMLEYCELDYDCVTIGVEMTENTVNKKTYDYTYKKNINHRIKGKGIAGRMPDHLCLWKRFVAQRVEFPNRNLGLRS